MSEPTCRRDFLVATACTGAALASGCGVEDTTAAGGPVGSVNAEPIGDPSKYPDSTRMPTTPTNGVMPTCMGTQGMVIGPAADSIGLNMAVRVPDANLPANLRGKPIYVARDSKGVFAYDMTCPHAGCLPTLATDRNIWICPCHASTFTITGAFIGGPANRSPSRWAVCSATDGLTRIDTSKTIP